MLKELETLDWMWASGKVEEIMMELLYMTERYKEQYGELVIIQRETLVDSGLLQSVTLCAVLSSKRATQ